MKSVDLNNGVKMPMLGYGVYQVSPEECERCVADALRHRAERGELRLADYPLLLHMDAVLREDADPVPPFGQFG